MKMKNLTINWKVAKIAFALCLTLIYAACSVGTPEEEKIEASISLGLKGKKKNITVRVKCDNGYESYKKIQGDKTNLSIGANLPPNVNCQVWAEVTQSDGRRQICTTKDRKPVKVTGSSSKVNLALICRAEYTKEIVILPTLEEPVFVTKEIKTCGWSDITVPVNDGKDISYTIDITGKSKEIDCKYKVFQSPKDKHKFRLVCMEEGTYTLTTKLTLPDGKITSKTFTLNCSHYGKKRHCAAQCSSSMADYKSVQLFSDPGTASHKCSFTQYSLTAEFDTINGLKKEWGLCQGNAIVPNDLSSLLTDATSTLELRVCLSKAKTPQVISIYMFSHKHPQRAFVRFPAKPGCHTYNFKGIDVKYDALGIGANMVDLTQITAIQIAVEACGKVKTIFPAMKIDLVSFQVLCKELPKSCSYSGKTYKHNARFFADDACNECQCNNGKVTCTQRNCGGKSCSYKGTTYIDGQSFPQGDNCNTCTCANGKVTCSKVVCSCSYKGSTYQNGSKFPAGDGCNTCNCIDGNVTCTQKACSCTYKGTKYSNGEKFPAGDGCNSCTCKNGKVDCGIKACSCTYKGTKYGNGEKFPAGDGCNTCKCDGGKVSCTKKACSCTYKGKTYSHGEKFSANDGCNTCSCKAGKVFCTQKACACGGLAGIKCAKNYICIHPPKTCGIADGGGTCQPKPSVCPKIYKPVCGCDGKTYTNKCFALITGVSIDTDGACKPKVCGTRGGIKCGNKEFCLFPAGQCGIADKGGSCIKKPEACPQNYAPVCGCNNKTYSNVCHAAASGVSVKHNGACRKQYCSYNGKKYHSGQKFKSGCNLCSCNNGKVSCRNYFCCSYKGRTYKAGQRFAKGDKCNTCICKTGGQVSCSSRVCYKSCTYKGKRIRHGQAFRDGCKTCKCYNGQVSCSTKTCTTSCSYKGTKYKHGQRFPAGDGCNSCYCSNGRVACTKRACPKVCTYKGKRYVHGQRFAKGDNCNICACYNGKVRCTQKYCPKKCSYKGKWFRHGQCFRDGCNACTCNNGRVSCKAKYCPKKCSYKGKWLRHGQSFKDGCNACTCNNGRVYCKRKYCYNTCSYKGKRIAHGQCFRDGCNACQCSNGKVTCSRRYCPNSCSYKGKRIPHGQKFKDGCNTCACNNGRIYCKRQACNNSCRFNGRTYKNGQRWSVYGCYACYCSNGKTTCRRR